MKSNSEYCLYDMPFSPFSRFVRLVLAEKDLPFRLVLERVWEKRPEFMAMSPLGKVPLLVTPDGDAIADSVAIVEYLEDAHPTPALLGKSPLERAEARRLMAWVGSVFVSEVSSPILVQCLVLPRMGQKGNDKDILAAAEKAMENRLAYLENLLAEREWLAGETLSMADASLLGHISVVHHLEKVDWQRWPHLSSWHAKMQQRPSYAALARDY